VAITKYIMHATSVTVKQISLQQCLKCSSEMSGSGSRCGREEFQHGELDDKDARRPRVPVCVRGTNSIRLLTEHRCSSLNEFFMARKQLLVVVHPHSMTLNFFLGVAPCRQVAALFQLFSRCIHDCQDLSPLLIRH